MVPSPLADPSPPLGLGLVAILVLLVWGMRSVPSTERGAVARVVGTHVGVTTAVLAMLSIWVARSIGPTADPFIGRVIQIFVSVAMIGIAAVAAAVRIQRLSGREPAALPEDAARGSARRARAEDATSGKTPGAIVVLAFAAAIGLLFVFLFFLLSRAP